MFQDLGTRIEMTTSFKIRMCSSFKIRMYSSFEIRVLRLGYIFQLPIKYSNPIFNVIKVSSLK